MSGAQQLIREGHRILAAHGLRVSHSRMSRLARAWHDLAARQADRVVVGASGDEFAQFVLDQAITARPLPRKPRNALGIVDTTGEWAAILVDRQAARG